MKYPVRNLVMASSLAVVGLAIAAVGIYVGETDDAPGAALMGLLLLIVALVFSVKIARRRKSPLQSTRCSRPMRRRQNSQNQRSPLEGSTARPAAAALPLPG